MAQLAPDEIPEDARELAELLARRLDVVTGRLELIYVDGRYVDGYRQERMRPKALADVSIGDDNDARSARVAADEP
jgi:hypothetical protein